MKEGKHKSSWLLVNQAYLIVAICRYTFGSRPHLSFELWQVCSAQELWQLGSDLKILVYPTGHKQLQALRNKAS